MYPYIGSIPLLGVGIVVTLLVFVWVFYSQAKQHHLLIAPFFQDFGYYIIGIFLLSTYSYYLFEDFVIVPLHRKQFLLYISPFDFHVHIVGTIIGILITAMFLYKRYTKIGQGSLFLRVFFDAFMIGTTVFGIFLVLGDNFFGLGSSILSLQPFTVHSQRAAFDATTALGLCVSLMSIICYSVLILWRHKQYHTTRLSHQPIEFIGWSAWCLSMFFITLQQHYPRHFVTKFFDLSFDIKQYLYIFLACFFLVVFVKDSFKTN